MPRYYRRRYTRVVRPKKRWASNIKAFTDESVTFSAAGFAFTTLVSNSAQSASPTPSVVKTGNFKLSIDSMVKIRGAAHTNPCFQFFVVYVPEAWDVNAIGGLIGSHPEWILASKTAGGSLTNSNVLSLETVNFSSRLKRNLNSGDGIVLVITANVSAGDIEEVKLNGHVRYWTCAN